MSAQLTKPMDLPQVANEVTESISRGDRNVTPSFREMQDASWGGIGLRTAFNSARAEVDQLTSLGGKAQKSQARQDIKKKWCIRLQSNQQLASVCGQAPAFRYLERFGVAEVRRAPGCPCWRQSVAVRYDCRQHRATGRFSGAIVTTTNGKSTG